jgi:type II secretory pathway pseudopilin PulG
MISLFRKTLRKTRMAKKLAKSANSQKRVLDAAAKIFRDYGYAGTTMRAIADEADLQAGSIYYHYKSKDDLIDPWGMPYVLDRPGLNGRDFDIISLGADKQRGGEGENADIVHGKDRKST